MHFTCVLPETTLTTAQLHHMAMEDIGVDACIVLELHMKGQPRVTKMYCKVDDGDLWGRRTAWSGEQAHEIRVPKPKACSKATVHRAIRDYLRAYYL